MPGDYTNNSFTSCEGEPAAPPGLYSLPGGGTSTFRQRYEGTYTADGVAIGYTVGQTVTPAGPYSTPATAKPSASSATTGIFIGGEFVASKSGKTLDTLNPVTGKTICGVSEGDVADVDLAVEAAQKAYDCEYSFPYDSPAGFLGLSSAIENVGVTAYLGAANKITDPAYVTAAGSILTTEARHQAWMNSAVLKGAAWSGPEDTPLGFSQVYSIAADLV